MKKVSFSFWFLILSSGLSTLMIISYVALIFAVLSSEENRPRVYESWATKKCAKVINSDGSEGSCDSLPDTYNHIWIK